jgi:thiamine-monophosphate kinase
MSGEGKGRGEFSLIADLFAPLTKGSKGALNLLDDAALIDVPPGCQIVAAADTLIAGIHFRDDDPPDLVARKALRVNLSDLAAMGAAPLGFLQTLALNTATDDAYLEKYAAGLELDINHFGIPLLGGDTTAGPGPLTISITALGTVEKGRALLRSGAKVGDVLCVTGSIGDGALGLACLEGSLNLAEELSTRLASRYQVPEPRIDIGRSLVGIASACADISDGLVADVGHICGASNVAAIVEQSAIPLSAGGRAAITQDSKWWFPVLGGGDDYELAFTVSEENLERVVGLGTSAGIPISSIGRIATATSDRVGTAVIDESGAEVKIDAPGFRHR